MCYWGDGETCSEYEKVTKSHFTFSVQETATDIFLDGGEIRKILSQL